MKMYAIKIKKQATDLLMRILKEKGKVNYKFTRSFIKIETNCSNKMINDIIDDLINTQAIYHDHEEGIMELYRADIGGIKK